MSSNLDPNRQYESVHRDYYDKIFVYCNMKLHFNRISAEDCTQRVFETFYIKMKDFYSMENVKAWLYRTADNYVKKYYRDWSKESKVIHFEQIDNYEEKLNIIENINYDDVITNEQIEKYKEIVISSLSQSNKELYQLRFLQNTSYSDLALKYKTSENTMRQRVFALKKEIIKQVMNCFKE